MENSKPHKRRNYLIDREFQFKFILKFCALVAAAGLLFMSILYFSVMQSTAVSIVNSRVMVRSTADLILPILIQTVIVVTIIISLASILVTLIISHKIAGPLYRFKKVIQELENGDFSSDFQIRNPDQLQELAKAFNSMIKKVRDEMGQLKENSFTLKEKLESFSEREISELKRPIVKELKAISEELNKLLHNFKT